MSLPSVSLVRKRIQQITKEKMRYCLMTAYLYAGRISEVVGHASPSDNTVARGPKGTDVKKEIFNLGPIDEPCVVFKVRTAKRDGRERSIALPTNYENWTSPLYEYFKSSSNGLVFPFTRQLVGRYVKEHAVFKGLRYPIETYSIWKDGSVVKKVDSHMRPFALHALRHLRATELIDEYGFDGIDLSIYGGWTLRSMIGVGSAMQRYAHLQWRRYFPKLLKKRA